MRGVNYDNWLTSFLDYEDDDDDLTDEEREQLEKEKRDWFDEACIEERELYDLLGRNL